MSASTSSRSKTQKMKAVLALAGVAGLAMLGSTIAPTADAVVTFGAANDSPGSIILGGLSSMVPKPKSMFEKYLVPGLLNMTGLGIEVNTSTRVIVSANASLANPFGPMTMPLGTVGLNIWLDDMSLANITTSEMTLFAGTAPINVTATIDIADGNTNPLIKNSLNNLVSSFLGGVTPSGVPPKLVVDNLMLGGNPLGMAPMVIPTQLPPAGPIPVSNVTAGTGVPPVFGFGGLMNPAINFTMPTLNKVTVKALTGAELKAGVAFTWENPLNIALDVPYLSIDLGLNGTRILTLGVEGIYLTPGHMTAETFVSLKFNNDAEAAVQLAALVNEFMSGTLSQTLNIGNFTFGAPGLPNTATEILLNTLASGLGFNLPLMGVSTVVMEEMIMSYIQPYLPIDISKLGGEGPSMMSYLQGLAVSTAPGHTLLVSPKIVLPLPFELDLNIPYFAIDINLNDSLMAQLFLADLVGTGSGQVAISVGIGLAFSEPSPSIPPAVAQIVNGLMTGSSIDVTAGVSNVAIGISPSDSIGTLNNLNIAAPISSVITGQVGTGDLFKDIMAQTNVTIAPNAIDIKIGSMAEFTIHEASISVLPNNLVTAGVSLDVFLGIPVVANIGFFGLQVSLDGSNLAGIDLTTGLNYGGGHVEMNAGVAISVGTGDAISTKVANLVNAIIAQQPVNSAVGVSGIVIGHSSSDLINALSEIGVSVPLKGLLGGSGPALPPGFIDSIVAKLGLSVKDLSLATIPNAGLQIGATAVFANPIPITVSVPFIGISGGLDHVDIVNVGLDHLGLTPGPNALQAGIDLNFNNAANAQTKVATLLGELLGGQLGNTPEDITAHNLRIGSSPIDYFDLFSKIDISIPSKSVLNKPNLDYLTAKLGLNATGAVDNLLKGVSLGAISLDLNKAPVMDLGASVSVSNFSINAAVNIGYFGVDLALDNHALARIDVPSITITTANNQLTLAVKAAITIQDTPEVQTDIAKLVDFFMTNTTTTAPVNSLVISRPLLGVSPSDHIQTFSLIQYPISLPPLLLKAKAYLNQMLAGAGGLNLNNIALSGLVVDLNSPSVISIQGGVAVKNLTLPADISINYVGVSLGLDTTPVADLTIPALALTSKDNTLSVTFNALIDLKQGPELSAQVARLVGALLSPGQVAPPKDLVIYDPVFGGDKNHLFHILSQIKVNVALAPYLQKIGAILNGAPGGANLLAGLDIGSLVVDLNSPQTIGIDAAISLKNITIPAEIKLNYVGINVALETIGLAQVSVPSFTLQPSNGALSITAHVDIALMTSDALTGAITNLITSIMSNQTTPDTIMVLSGAVFGGSPTNVFTVLEAIAIPINIAPYINKIPALLAGAGSLANRVAISNLVLDLNAPQVIGIDAAVSIKNVTLPAEIKLNYVGANVAIGQVPLVALGIPAFKMTPNNGNLDIAVHMNLALQDSPALSATINGLVHTILAGQPIPTTALVISGAAFGGAPDKVFTFLQGIKIPLDVTAYLNKAVAMLNGALAGGGNLLAGLDIGSLVVDLNSPQTIGIDADIAIKNVTIPAEIKLNYVGINVAIDTIGLAQVSVPSFSLIPGNGALGIKAHVDIALMTSDALTGAITNLITGIMSNQTTPDTNLVLSGTVFGGSPTSVFTILQAVAIPINVAPYINKIPALLAGAGSMANRVAISNLVLDLNAPQVIGIDAAVSIKNVTLPAEIKLNYVGANVAIGQVPLVALGIPAFKMTPNNGNLDIAVHMNLALQDSPALSATINGLVHTILAGQPIPTTALVISGAAFGGAPDKVFTFLQGIKIPLDVTAYLNKAVAMLNGALAGGGNLLAGLDIGSLVVDLNSPQTIGIDADIAIKNVTIPAEIKLNYVGINVAIDTVGLAQVSVPSFSLIPGNGALGIKAHVDIALMTSDALTGAITKLVTGVISNQTTPDTNLVLSGTVFGASPTNVFTILQAVAIPINVAPYINKIPGLLAGAGTLGGRVAFGALVVDLNAPQVIGIDTSVSIKNVTLPAEIKLNYVGANVAIGQVPLVALGIPAFKMTPNNGNLDIALRINLAMQESDGLTATINGLVQTILAGKPLPPTDLVISGAAFGGAPDRVFTFLQGVKIPIEISAMINKLLAGAGTGASLLNGISFSDLVIDLNAPQVIGIDASVLVRNVTLPAEIKLNYVGANVAINTIPLAQVSIPNFSMAPQGADLALKVHVELALLSSPEISKAISGLVGGILGNQTLPQTNLIISGAVFGSSPTNVFTFLQNVAIPVDVSAMIAKIGGSVGGAGSLLNGIGLSGLAINLNQAPVVGIDANIAVRNVSLPAKLNVGYFGLDIGYSGVPLVGVSIPKIVLGSSGGDLTIGTHIDATLVDSDASQSVVAGLVSAVVAGQAPQGNLVISGIAFGPNKGNVYTILQGVQIPIPISKILTLVPSTGTNATSILNSLDLQSADIIMKNPPSIGADVAIALLGYQFDAQLLLSYVSISAFLDTTPLATISVPGINLSSGNNQIALSVHSLVNLASGAEIQGKVAAIAGQVMGGGGGSDNVNLVVSKIAFGGGPDNVFHILDKVKVSVPLAPYIQKLTGIVGGITGGAAPAPGAPTFSISNLEISAPGANDLSIAVAAAIGGIGSKISVEMPYIGLEVSAGGHGFVYPTVNNFQLKNGNVALTLALPFQPAAKGIIASLSTPVSQLMFSTVGQVPGSIVVNSVKFGASPSQAFDIAAKIGLEIQLNSVFQKAQAFINANNPLHVEDMNTVLTTTGIQANLAVTGVPLTVPLKMNFPIALEAYHRGNAMVAITASGFNLASKPWNLGANINVIQPAFSSAVNSILVQALTWENAMKDVTIGGIKLGSFTALSGLMITPPDIRMWSPITIPLNMLKIHLSPLGMDFAAAFKNNGPLQVDMGTIDIMIKQGSTDVLQIVNLNGPIHINNGRQSAGDNKLALNASLRFNFLEFFKILGALFNPSNFQFAFSFRTSAGQPMPWLQDALNGVPAAILSNILPIIAKALSNINFGF